MVASGVQAYVHQAGVSGCAGRQGITLVMVGKASVLGQHPNGMGRQWSRIAYRFLPADRQYMDAGTKSSTTNLGTDS